MMRLIFIGPPGAGKGTQASKLAQHWQVPHIATGDILRQAVAEQTPLGIKAKSYMDAGDLVPDSLVIDLIEERLQQSDTKQGWILDGFPRNTAQADALNTLLANIQQPCDRAVSFTVSTEALVKRMLGRGRKDDNEDTIRHRLKVYEEQTAPLLAYYQQRHQLTTIDGNHPVDEVTRSLHDNLQALSKV